MLFNSWQFIFAFLPVVLLGFFLLPSFPLWPRKLWLIAASLMFYGYWKPEYIPLLLFSICFNYTIAETISRCANGRTAKAVCAGGVAVNLLLLGYFKYANFFLRILGGISHHPFRGFDILLPLAISFFTFTQISYIVDVYRDPRLHYRFLDYALFVVFFPHLISGPIVRHWEIIPQFAARPLRTELSDGTVGLALFLMGLFKKVLLADWLASYVTTVYSAANATTVDCFDAWFATIAFALQIYFDFSGYSDMAIGLARFFGVRFPMNFNSPYQASSINEFWRRWHITLTRFLREYVYFPLGGNRCGQWRHSLNIIVTMLLSGLWHGAGWTFVIWGGLHGAYLVIAYHWHRLIKDRWRTEAIWYRLAATALTFGATLLAWVFFRAPTTHAALNLWSSLFATHGFTMSTDVTNPARFPGTLWSWLGVRFIAPGFQVDSYDDLIKSVLLMLVLVFLAPNSQALVARYRPVLEQMVVKERWQLKLGWLSGIAMGAVFFLVIRSFFVAAPSPFVYFNF